MDAGMPIDAPAERRMRRIPSNKTLFHDFRESRQILQPD